jgi:2'-5' RNA ligase/lambda repressor-like predicted transcriptional regulator
MPLYARDLGVSSERQGNASIRPGEQKERGWSKMPNERLHNAMREVGITVQDLAGAADVDPKTVGRRLTQDRIPYPRHRRKVAACLRTDEASLWPTIVVRKSVRVSRTPARPENQPPLPPEEPPEEPDNVRNWIAWITESNTSDDAIEQLIRAHVYEVVRDAQERLSGFSGLHMTPLDRLHMTILVAGSTDEIAPGKRQEMLAQATPLLARTAPIDISLGRVLYHPEAIALQARPASAMTPVLNAVQTVTRAATNRKADREASATSWVPHVTLCYSTGRQPVAPILAALGKEVPGCDITINAVDLVVQHGPERLWNWHSAGTVRLGGEQ